MDVRRPACLLHASDLEGRGVVRAGQRAGQALLRHRDARRLVPSGARQGRRPDQVPARLLDRRRGGAPTPTSPRATRPRTARWSSSTTTDMAELPVDVVSARSRSRSSCRASRSTRCCSRSPTTSSPRRPAPSPTRCCGRRCSTPTGWRVVTVALRNRTSLAVLRVRDDVIVLQTMMWPDEIRHARLLRRDRRRQGAEVKMANMLVETLAGDFEPDEFEDDYADGRRGAGQGQDRGRRGQAHPDRRPSPPARWSTCSPRCSSASTRRRPPAARPTRRRSRPRRSGGEEDHEEGRGQEEAGQEGELTLLRTSTCSASSTASTADVAPSYPPGDAGDTGAGGLEQHASDATDLPRGV